MNRCDELMKIRNQKYMKQEEKDFFGSLLI